MLLGTLGNLLTGKEGKGSKIPGRGVVRVGSRAGQDFKRRLIL